MKLKTEENLVKLNEVFALLRNVNKLSRILLCQKNAPLFWEDMPADDQELIKYFLRQGLYYFASNTGADHWRFFQRVTQQKLVLIKCIFSAVSNDCKGILGTFFRKMSGVLTQEFAFTLHSLFLTCIDLECFESGGRTEKRGKFKLSIFSKSPKSNPTTFGVLVKMANNSIAELIAKFKLEGHPEGGFYRMRPAFLFSK